MPVRIVIAGSGFAGMAAARRLRKLLKDEAEIIVMSDLDRFVFQPSLIWVPFGLRSANQISLPLELLYKDSGIVYRQCEITRFVPEHSQLATSAGSLEYDMLLVATGPAMDYSVPGMGPHTGFTQSIYNLEESLLAKEAFDRFLADPGPVVIGSGQGASCYGAAYEFLFNCAYQLRKRGLDRDCPITYITSEPFIGHFGLGGFGTAPKLLESYCEKLGVTTHVNTEVESVSPDTIKLTSGLSLSFKYAMLTPRFFGVPPLRDCTLSDDDGWVHVDDYYRSFNYDNVYAAGSTVSIMPKDKTPVPCEFPKTGHMSENMARLAAYNMAAALQGGRPVSMKPECINAMCVVDGGSTGYMMYSDMHYQSPEVNTWVSPGPHAHWAKLAFERFYLLSKRLRLD